MQYTQSHFPSFYISIGSFFTFICRLQYNSVLDQKMYNILFFFHFNFFCLSVITPTVCCMVPSPSFLVLFFCLIYPHLSSPCCLITRVWFYQVKNVWIIPTDCGQVQLVHCDKILNNFRAIPMQKCRSDEVVYHGSFLGLITEV